MTREVAGVKDVREITLALLNARAPEGTICPSEVARASVGAANDGSGAQDWRSIMPAVHTAIDCLVAEGTVRISWKGKPLAARVGPYRIGRNKVAG